MLKETEPTPAGESPKNGSLATPIGSVSMNSVSGLDNNVNGKMSLGDYAGSRVATGNNIYGRDVALESREETVPTGDQPDPDQVAPTAEDIAAMEQALYQEICI